MKVKKDSLKTEVFQFSVVASKRLKISMKVAPDGNSKKFKKLLQVCRKGKQRLKKIGLFDKDTVLKDYFFQRKGS